MCIKRTLLAMIISLGLNGQLLAEELELNPDHPTRYVVVKGDTLWEISAKFLRDPWRWPELWNLNPAINNPHLIYPGDAISLVFREGKPTLEIERGQQVVKLSPEPAPASATQTVKLSPTAHATPLTQAIPTVASDVIRQFLGRPRVLSKEAIDNAGYLAAAEEGRLISGSGTKVFARNLAATDNNNFAVYHIGQPYFDPNNKRRVLGYEALHVADLTLLEPGDPSTLRISKAVRGEIVSILDGLWRAGQYQSVVINKGSKDGLEAGHVLAVYQSGLTVRDKDASRRGSSDLTLPDNRAGLVMVYRSFDNVSYALIMNAVRDIRANDSVTNP
ncbi:MAG: LysM peptidoglycan-binding domain-containing protein [Gammaproteobacteria bacterium]|nr:LysM peptidoglycan-binding domain-containing protein [Gammaproteobacteria bacterium]